MTGQALSPPAGTEPGEAKPIGGLGAAGSRIEGWVTARTISFVRETKPICRGQAGDSRLEVGRSHVTECVKQSQLWAGGHKMADFGLKSGRAMMRNKANSHSRDCRRSAETSRGTPHGVTTNVRNKAKLGENGVFGKTQALGTRGYAIGWSVRNKANPAHRATAGHITPSGVTTHGEFCETKPIRVESVVGRRCTGQLCRVSSFLSSHWAIYSPRKT
jgi:hypothetical protein